MKALLPVILLAAAVAAQRVSVPTTASFRGLSIVSNKVVWASGTEGTVIRTSDGGKNWSVFTVAGAEKLDFRGIHAFNATTALIMSSGPAEKGQARIYRTADGGKNWTKVFEEKRNGIFFDAIAFWDSKHGIVLSDPVGGHFVLFVTNDAGITWKQIPAAALPPSLPNEGAFAASNSCLVVHGNADVWFATGGAAVARVFRSTDRGHTWAVAETSLHPKNASSGIFSLTFTTAKNGVAAGGDYQHPESSDLPNLLRTRDGGRTWQSLAPTNPAGIYFSSVALDHHRVLAAGIQGLWTYVHTWKQESAENLNAVRVLDDSLWAVGPKGVILHNSSPANDQNAHVPM